VPELATPATDEAAALSLAWFRGVRAAGDRPTGLSELDPSFAVDAGSQAGAAAAEAGSSREGAGAAGRAAAAAEVQAAVPSAAEPLAKTDAAAATGSGSAGAPQPPSAPQTPLGIPSLPLQRPCSSDYSLSNAALTESPSLEALASAEVTISAVASVADVASLADPAAAAAEVPATDSQVQPAPLQADTSSTASGPQQQPPYPPPPPMTSMQQLGRQLQQLSTLPPPPTLPPLPPVGSALHVSTLGVPPPAPPKAPYPGQQPGTPASASPHGHPQPMLRAFPPPPPPPGHAPPASAEAYHQMVALQVRDCLRLQYRHARPYGAPVWHHVACLLLVLQNEVTCPGMRLSYHMLDDSVWCTFS
jgi:hypothetical protein